jgi:hypothetical protein
MRLLRQTLSTKSVSIVRPGEIDREEYVWLSPLGEKNHAQRLARTTKTNPMMILELVSIDCVSLLYRNH